MVIIVIKSKLKFELNSSCMQEENVSKKWPIKQRFQVYSDNKSNAVSCLQ